MTKYVMAICGAIILGLGALLFFESKKADRWQKTAEQQRITIESHEAVIETQRKAAAAHQEYVERAEATKRRLTALRNQIESMEGGDEALSDYLAGVARKLYGSD